jgi:hypothetical protein
MQTLPCDLTERALSQFLLIARRVGYVKRFGEGRFWSGGIVKCAKVPNNKFQTCLCHLRLGTGLQGGESGEPILELRICISLRTVTTCTPYPRETLWQPVIPAKSRKAGREPGSRKNLIILNSNWIPDLARQRLTRPE